MSKIQLTEQHAIHIQVLVQDQESKELMEIKWIKRAELAKLMHQFKVIGARNGLFIIEK